MSLRAAVFDFDNTLCIHPINRVFPDGWDAQFTKDTFCMEWEKIYKDCIAPEAMKRLIGKIQGETGADVMMLSHVRFSHYVTAKEAWLEKEYGGIFRGRCYGCGTRADKLRFLQMLCEYYGCSPAEIILVEDNDEVIQECRKEGFVVLDTINVLLHNGEISFSSGRNKKNINPEKGQGWGRDQLEIMRNKLLSAKSLDEADQLVGQYARSNTCRNKLDFLQKLFGFRVDVGLLGEDVIYQSLLTQIVRDSAFKKFLQLKV